MQENTDILERMLTNKKEMVRLFLIATVLAFSVGTLANLLVAQSVIPKWSIFCISACLIVLSFALLAKDLSSSLSFQEEADGVIFIDPEANEIVRVKDYRLAEKLQQTMRAVKAESKAIYSEWEKEPIVPVQQQRQALQSHEDIEGAKPSYISIFKLKVDPQARKLPKSVRLLEEAVSFVVMEELSLHLSTYFNDSDEDSFVKEYSRNDIPEFLLQNRVLNLLSTPIEQRDIFLNAYPDDVNRPEGEIYTLWGSDGAVYSRFDLVLPRGTSIKHSDSGGIKIETKRLSLELSAKYYGTCAVVSSAFIAKYIGEHPEKIQCRKVAITLKGRIKPMSLLLNSGWQYYRWLDSFRERLKASFDFGQFQSDIHWSIIEPLLFSMRGSKRTKASKSAKGHEVENG